jgi:hypothetical protein
MYTVMRFVAEPKMVSGRLEHLGGFLNAIADTTFRRLDKAGGRFSVSISTAESWPEHAHAIASFISLMRSAIVTASDLSIRVELDVAIEPEDLAGGPYTCLTVGPEFMADLAELGITLTFSIVNVVD